MERKIFTDEIRNFVVEHYKGCSYYDLADKINKEFSTNFSTRQITNFCYRNKYNNGYKNKKTQFSKGHIPWNKGKNVVVPEKCRQSWFKKGNKPLQTKPIGYERIDHDGYILVKVSDNNFVPKQRLIYEKHHGVIPDDRYVIFLDGDKRNFDINNLALVSRAENLELIRKNLRTNDTELTKAGVIIAKINCKSRTLRKQKGNDKNDVQSD